MPPAWVGGARVGLACSQPLRAPGSRRAGRPPRSCPRCCGARQGLDGGAGVRLTGVQVLGVNSSDTSGGTMCLADMAREIAARDAAGSDVQLAQASSQVRQPGTLAGHTAPPVCRPRSALLGPNGVMHQPGFLPVTLSVCGMCGMAAQDPGWSRRVHDPASKTFSKSGLLIP